MPWLFLFSILFTVIGMPALWGGWKLAHHDSNEGEGETLFAGGGILALLAIVFLIWSCMTVVSTRNVGIVTSFGKPVATRSNGLAVKWPWEKVPELSGTIQTDNQIGGWDGPKCTGGTPVRLANNSTACVDNTIRWRIQPSAGDELFRDYSDDANIRDSLVTRELNAALNREFADYNPLSADGSTGPDLGTLSAKVTKDLQDQLHTQIDVQNVIISIVHFDPQTQDKINAYQAQIANTRIAEESQKTAAAQAQANQILAGSVNNSMNVLISRCLDLINAGKPVPAGFSCFPGNDLPVTIPAR